MGFYDRHILPRIIDFACGMQVVQEQRLKVVPQARGTVLEIGAGSGHNLPLYDKDRVERVWALEPSLEMRERATPNLTRADVEIQWLDLPGERIPLEDASVDTVLVTFTLCTIPDHMAALRQMHRVLKPDGRLLFCEHSAAPDAGVRRWQERLNRTWNFCFGGCNLNRRIPESIRAAGFDIVSMDAMYLPGTPRFAAWNCWGEAKSAGR